LSITDTAKVKVHADRQQYLSLYMHASISFYSIPSYSPEGILKHLRGVFKFQDFGIPVSIYKYT